MCFWALREKSSLGRSRNEQCEGRLFGQFSLLASPSKTVISRANPLALYYFPGIRLPAFARARARKVETEL
jgi:hypothetical protein